MKLARYAGQGIVTIVDEPKPACPKGGLLVKTLASGLCSGELMAWYMDRKIPHVLGHEVSGVIVESDDARFAVGHLIAPHHHAPCMHCKSCQRRQYVHCPQWKSTRLVPGGMAEFFAVAKENLTDAWLTDDLAPEDAALTEPLACVVKSLRQAGRTSVGVAPEHPLVIGLGFMGLLHMKLLGPSALGCDLSPSRISGAKAIGCQSVAVADVEPASADSVFVCPGSRSAFDLACRAVAPMGTIVLFAPFGDGGGPAVDLDSLYFRDVTIACSYSAGPNDCEMALMHLRQGDVRAKDVVSDFITLDQLPDAYAKMKRGEILKPMVMFR